MATVLLKIIEFIFILLFTPVCLFLYITLELTYFIFLLIRQIKKMLL